MGQFTLELRVIQAVASELQTLFLENFAPGLSAAVGRWHHILAKATGTSRWKIVAHVKQAIEPDFLKEIARLVPGHDP